MNKYDNVYEWLRENRLLIEVLSGKVLFNIYFDAVTSEPIRKAISSNLKEVI